MQLVLAIYYDMLAGDETIFDQRFFFLERADFYLSPLHTHVVVHDEGVAAFRSSLDDRSWNHRPMPDLEKQSRIDELSRPQPQVRIGEGRLESNGSRRGID